MRDFLDGKIIAAKNYAKRCIEDLKSERGASDMVTIILIILVVVAVAAIFKEKLIELVENLFGKLNESVEGAGTI